MIGKGIEVSPRSRADIRQKASSVREVMRSLTGDASHKFDIINFLDIVLPRIFPGFILQILPIQEMRGNHGLTYPDINIMQIREDIFLGADQGNGRDRMTLAHELGHLILHKNIALPRKGIPKFNLPRFCDSEWQADCFGAELLVEHSQLSFCRNASDVVEMFGVTMVAAQYQWDVRNNNV